MFILGNVMKMGNKEGDMYIPSLFLIEQVNNKIEEMIDFIQETSSNSHEIMCLVIGAIVRLLRKSISSENYDLVLDMIKDKLVECEVADLYK